MQELKGHRFFETQDGSLTAYSERYNEACHSTAGAVAETQIHYIKGCQIEKRPSPIHIFEVGFGVGVGFFETHKSLSPLNKFFDFVSIEIDEELVKYIIQQNETLNGTKRLEEQGLVYYEKQNDDFRLRILIGDGRQTVPVFFERFPFSMNAIYQDAFSFKKNRELWSTEWFTLLRKNAAPDCLMSTYSSSSAVRKSMIEAGWKVFLGDHFGPRVASTRARLTGESDKEVLDKLQRSHVEAIKDHF